MESRALSDESARHQVYPRPIQDRGTSSATAPKNKAIDSLKGVIKEYIDTEIINDDGYFELAENLEFKWIDDETVDPLDQAKIDQIYLQSGVKSINEVRRMNGDDPISGGNKPFVVVGQNVVTIDPDPISEEEEEDPLMTSTRVSLPPKVRYTELSGNSLSIAWMDDRGVTQPLFVTDSGKTKGFTVKPSFWTIGKAGSSRGRSRWITAVAQGEYPGRDHHVLRRGHQNSSPSSCIHNGRAGSRRSPIQLTRVA